MLTYSEIHDILTFGSNRYYYVNELRPGSELNDSEKLKNFNLSITSYFQIPIRFERLLFDTQQFKMHWHPYGGAYLSTGRTREEIMLEYTGSRELPISPVKYAAVLEMSGGMWTPFELVVYDNTLTCVYQEREDRCSRLKVINFGHQKSDQKTQTQFVTFKNLNPNSIHMSFTPYSPPLKNLQLKISVGQPVPYYSYAVSN
jgi:hypothetical protein